MKFNALLHMVEVGLSHPTRGAWIEIVVNLKAARKAAGSHPTRGAWIEIPNR